MTEEAANTPAPIVLADPDSALIRPEEFGTLALHMAKAYRRMVTFYQKQLEKDLPEALALAARCSTEELHAAFLEGLRAEAPDQVSWYDLRSLEDGREGDALRKWEEVKAFARDELSSGMRGAAAVEDLSPSGSGPLGRARYIALVQEMAKDWQPLSGTEYLLVEQMAQAYTMQLYWMGIFGHREVYNIGKMDHERGTWEPPLVTRQQALDDAAGMVDRWNRMFLRCLRQLRDLRRYSPVVIQNAGQVNLGHQQVNVSGSESAAKPTAGAQRKAKRLGRGKEART